MFTIPWDVKEPTHYSKRVGHEVPGVVAVLCENIAGPHQLIAAKKKLNLLNQIKEGKEGSQSRKRMNFSSLVINPNTKPIGIKSKLCPD